MAAMNFISRKMLRIYKVPFAVLLFIVLFGAFHTIKPGFAYLPNGAYRPFGVGYKHKTVVPVWLVAVFLAILSYLAILFVLSQT
jgi:hypothetical protein